MLKETQIPAQIILMEKDRSLKIKYKNGQEFDLSAEYLRVYSPSAEVKGHHPSQAILQIGKSNVAITEIESVGNYAIRLIFDDGHRTGIFTWPYLHELASNQDNYWQDYLERLRLAKQEH